jgi:hypothetical protein
MEKFKVINDVDIRQVSTTEKMKPFQDEWVKNMNKSLQSCNHINEKMWQGDGFVYITCKDCGIDL